MSIQGPSVGDTNAVAAGVVAAMKMLGASIPPAAEKFFSLMLAWLINEAQKEAFEFAASATSSPLTAPGVLKVSAAFRHIAAESGSVAARARAEIDAMGKPS